MPSTTPNQPTAESFYMFEADMESNRQPCGVRFDNVRHLLSPPRLILRPEEGGFPTLRETPQLTYDPNTGPAPRDLEPGFSGYWLVSERLHDVMVSVDSDAFAFAEVDYRLADGTKGPRHFLCDVVRELDALDEVASKLQVEVDDDYVNGKFYSVGGGASLAFRPEVVCQAHVFLTPFSSFVICDRAFKDAVHDAGIPADAGESGISFIDASDI
ncbi:DUF1629 domain-containing protein [Xanthomonas nasturtii]|uniref:DUF1629 domain-containing protein n=1 Tax=Xanthomonas nasturtii TaxID=1843581 RepID=UPI002010E8FA|nr:DUF1629 domain-containing protein [Xanthomonas nasturtii]MCL1501501.1 DUF1629 domain-containing protein [Xanthomonas nasturtii]MCL1505415.1 DUF1629 domain-containing protein [Xanthomonas nasturtii]MCL1524901.1 DUF1629 domain-containing protein [Xanthomonas nasturtii]